MSAVATSPAADGFALLASRPPTSGSRLRLMETVPTALGALRSNKARSILTTLGIIIGVAAVIAIVALGQGATASVQGQLQGLGVNVLTILPASSRTGGVSAGAGTSITLKAADTAAIEQSVPGVTAVSPVVSGGAQVIAGGNNWATRIQSVTPAYEGILDWQIASGAFFTTQDDSTASSVAVLGQTVVSNLFPGGQSPVGQLVRVRNMPFTVVGVLASKGTGPGGDQDDVVLIPFQTGQVRLFGSTSINQMVVQVSDAGQMDATTQRIEQLLRQRHGLQPSQADDFTIRSNNDIINRISGVTQTMTLLLGVVAGVSLVVGGIGIMNIMLVSVTERTREIGIRLAIGAQPGDVLAQFLVEAVVLAILGGGLGTLLGSVVALLMPIVAGWNTVLPWSAIALSFGVSAAIGVFFGIYPARRASQLDPIVALRHE
jgi:putative ABC transport system permease protein